MFRAMEKLRCYTLTLYALVPLAPLAAHEHPLCKHTTENSCWTISNTGKQAITLRCESESGAPFVVKSLAAGKSWSYQYCSGLADGLGYAAGDVTCRAERGGKQAVTFKFSAKNFGDRIQFTVTEKKVLLKMLPVGTTERPAAEFELP